MQNIGIYWECRVRGLYIGSLDAIGLQAHGLEGYPAADIQRKLDYLWEQLQVPMYITEYDVEQPDDAKQL